MSYRLVYTHDGRTWPLGATYADLDTALDAVRRLNLALAISGDYGLFAVEEVKA
jgi:hypothetical protein